MEEVRYIICNLFRGLKEKEQPSAFVLENLNNKNPLRGHIQGSKTWNTIQRRYLEIKKEETVLQSRLSSLKWKKQCNRDVFREWNKWSKASPI